MLHQEAGCRMHSLVILVWLTHWAATTTLAVVSADDAINSTNPHPHPHSNAHPTPSVGRLLVMTSVQDMEDENFKRFNRSIETYKLDLTVLRRRPRTADANADAGADADAESSSSQLALIRKALATYKSEPNLLLMIVDSQSSILNGNQKDIVERFAKFGPQSRVIFGADSICWPPDRELASKFSAASTAENGRSQITSRYLNAGAYIGYATALWDLFNEQEPLPADTSQTFFTRAYLNATLRDRLGLRVDHRAQLIQNLRDDERNLNLTLAFDDSAGDWRLENLAHSTEPVLVVLGSNSGRVQLNSLGNYLARAWTPNEGCRHCDRDKITLPKDDEDSLPTVLIGVFIEFATPFLEGFFENLVGLNYPKRKIHLLVHNSVAYHEPTVRKFLLEFGPKYAGQQVLPAQEPEWQARDAGLWACKRLNCDYYLALDAVARIELADTLRILIETNRTIVAPLLNRPTKLWSNFWGSITSDGFYARSQDYVDLVKREREGLWSAAHTMNAQLMSGRFISDNLSAAHNNNSNETEKAAVVALTYREQVAAGQTGETSKPPALVFASQLRAANVQQHLLNTHDFGHLVDPTSYNISLTNPDFYQLEDNVLDWERTYLHENYSRLLDEDEDERLEQPCQDVFWFPLVSELFCRQLIEIMERYGQWSGGTNDDPRIEGGYESVPTRDIHMKQVGLHEMWLAFLRDYVMPVQLKEYIGYEHDPPRADLAFVVRYHPAEQASLQPHHDSSTYTLNIALNSPGADYEGGGCRFQRYNCSVTQSRRGWALMHPGRLTHYHEGLPVTSGTRYIMVTFVDP